MFNNFGKSLLKNNSLGSKGRKTLKANGFANKQDFLNTTGIDLNNTNQEALRNALLKGKNSYLGGSGSETVSPQDSNKFKNFGNKLLDTGKLGSKGREALQDSGFVNKQDFLNTSGIDLNNTNQEALRNALLKGRDSYLNNNNSSLNTPNSGTTNVTQSSNTPSIESSLVGQGVDLANKGIDILNNGSSAAKSLSQQGGTNFIGGQQDLGKVDALAAAARNQGVNILNTLQQQQRAANQDISNYFNAQPLDSLRSNIAQLNNIANVQGRSNSRSANEIDAELKRGLIRDQGNAQLQSNNNYRNLFTKELGDQRSLDANLSSLFSGQGLGQANLSNSNISNSGQLENNANNIGANIANQGFQNQLGSLGFINDVNNNNFLLRNQLLQQYLANNQGRVSNARANRYQQEQLELAKQQLESGGVKGFLKGALSGLGGIGGSGLGGSL